jgi:hypothetical protein
MSSFSKSFGEFLIRTAGFLAAVVAIGLTVGLVWKFTGGQDHVAIGVALLSVFISSVGLLLARSAWRRTAYPEFLLGCAMWIAGAAFLGFNELGYWAASYEGRHEAYTHLRKVEQRKEGLKDRAWVALTTGEVPISSAQLEAQIKAKRYDPLYDRSKQCTDATASSSRAFCGELATLEAKLAGAVQVEKLESQVTANGVAPEAVKADTLDGMNVFANAEWLSRKFGGTEREWADYILLTGLAVLMLVRDMGFLVAFPLGRRPQAAVAAKPEPAVTVAVRSPRGPVGFSKGPLAGVPDRPATRLSHDELRAAMAGAGVVTLGTDPKPDGGGTSKPQPKPEADEEAAENVVHLPTKAERREQKKATAKKKVTIGDIRVWLKECTVYDEYDTSVTPSGTLRKAYIKWCVAGKFHPVGFKRFTRIIKTECQIENDRLKRTQGGQTLIPGLKLANPAQWQSQQRFAA